MINIKWKSLIINIAIPLAIGGLSALLTMNSMEKYQSLNTPPLSPPGWIFPIVWTFLFILMGIVFGNYINTSNRNMNEYSNIGRYNMHPMDSLIFKLL